MTAMIQNSLIVRLCMAWFARFVFLYNESVLKKCVTALARLTRTSLTFQLASRYIHKKPYYTNSFSYRAIMGISGLAERTADWLYGVCDHLTRGSVLRKWLAKPFAHYENLLCVLAFYQVIDYYLRIILPAYARFWNILFYLFLIGVWAAKTAVYRENPAIKVSPLDLPVIVFVTAMTFILIIHSPDFKVSLEGYRVVVQHMMWFFIVLQVLKTEKGARNLCLALVLMVSAIALHGVYQYVIGADMPSGWTDINEAGVRTRVYSIIGSPNILGGLMTLTLPLSVSFVFTAGTTKKRLLCGGLSGLIALALVFSFSRGAWLGFAGAALVYVSLKDKRLIIPVVLLGVIASLLVPSIGDRIVYMMSPEYIESSLRGGRLIRWLKALEILKQDPVIGVGLGHFGGAAAINNGIVRMIGIELNKAFYIDNYYLKTTVEAGLIGLFAFAALMWQVFINAVRTISITQSKAAKELATGAAAGLVGVMLHNLVENVFEVPMMVAYFWMLAAVLMHFWLLNSKESL